MAEAGLRSGVEAGLRARFRQAGPIPLDAELRCAPGEVLALLGPSGSGKTTILRAIAGLYRPREGRVSVGGEVWLDTARGLHVPPHRRRAGLVFQSYALFPHLDARGNVEAALGRLPASERALRARALLGLVNLSGLETRRPAELSGGQQQRVALARALAREPAVLLLDEPFSAVDRSTRHGLYRELAEIREGLAAPVVFVTHDFDEAARLASRIALLDRGEVLQTGAPRDVLQRPASLRAARLVDNRNLFEATVLGHVDGAGEGGRRLTVLDWAGRRLVCEARPDMKPGTRAAWSIPGTNVLISRTDLAEPDATPNRFPARVRTLAHLSESLAATVELPPSGAEARAPVLSMTLPAHYARRTRLGPGSAVTVALMPDGIHLMPLER